MIKLIATDLDGTLFHDREMHVEDKNALSKVLARDIPVVPVTTRMRYSSSEMLRGIPISRYPLVCMNGAVVNGPGWDDETHEIWMEKNHQRDIAEAVSSYVDERGYEVTTVFAERKFWKLRDGQRPDSDPLDPVTRLVERNRDALEYGSPISYMMHDDRNGKEGLRDMEKFAKTDCNGSVTVHRHHRMGEWVALTIYPCGVNKRKGLELVCDKMGISMKEVLAIGNDEVDGEMISSAGVGIAVDNSPAEIKSAADDIAPSCTEQGFSWAVKKYIL